MNWLELLNIPLSVIQNTFNSFMQDKQNKHNEKLVDMQNKAAERQAEKAYIRSLPSNQMQNMRSAGVSDFAAAQAISGGGTYQPAPVNTSQGQAPQIDLNGAMQAITTSMQLKQEMKMQDKLLAAQKAENAANRATQKDIAQLQADASKYSADSSSSSSKYTADSAASTAAARLAFENTKWNDEVKVLRAQIRNLDANTSLTKEQKEQLIELKPYLKENAIEEVNKLKEEVKSIKSVRDLETKRFALERLKVRLESYYGVSINHMRSTLEYWMDKPENIYKGFQWRKGELERLDSKEKDLHKYLEELNELLDSLDD